MYEKKLKTLFGMRILEGETVDQIGNEAWRHWAVLHVTGSNILWCQVFFDVSIWDWLVAIKYSRDNFHAVLANLFSTISVIGPFHFTSCTMYGICRQLSNLWRICNLVTLFSDVSNIPAIVIHSFQHFFESVTQTFFVSEITRSVSGYCAPSSSHTRWSACAHFGVRDS